MRNPRYRINECLLLSNKRHGDTILLPTKIKINLIFMDDDKVWKYRCYDEHNNSSTSIYTEQEIMNRLSKQKAECYRVKYIKELVCENYRFVGNFYTKDIVHNSNKIINNECTSAVIVTDAVDKFGNDIQDKYGIWVKYLNTICEDGSTEKNTIDDILIEFEMLLKNNPSTMKMLGSNIYQK